MIEIACWKFDCPFSESHVTELVAKLIELYTLTYINCHDKSLLQKIRARMNGSYIPYKIYRMNASSERLLESLYSTYYAHIDKTSVYLQCDIYTYTRLVKEDMHVNYAFWGPPDEYCGYDIREDANTYPKEFREKVMALHNIEKIAPPIADAEENS